MLRIILLSFIVFGVVLLWYWFKYRVIPVWIGKMGEGFVRRKLRKLDPAHYRVLNDLLLPSKGNLNETQIDHVVVSNYGIFCIETKAYKGWVFGNAKQKYWIVTYKHSHHKERPYNPMYQNYAHVKAIESLVKPSYPNISIIPLVAFPRAGKIKVSGTDSVGRVRDIIRKIRNYKTEVLSDIDRDRIYEILAGADIKDKSIRKEHVKGIRRLKKSKRR